MVWPALLPPWKRATTSPRSASRSVSFPFPSSPHWAPTITIPGIPIDDYEVSGRSVALAARRGGARRGRRPQRASLEPSGVRRVEHLGNRAAHPDFADRILEALDLEVRKLLAHELGRQLDGMLGRVAVVAGRDRVQEAVAAVDRLVGHEPRHRFDRRREALVNALQEFVHLFRSGPVLADARVHRASSPWGTSFRTLPRTGRRAQSIRSVAPGPPGRSADLRRDAAHPDLADRRLDALDLEVGELVADEVRRQVDGALRRVAVVAGGGREDDPVATVEQLVGDEPRHRLDAGGERLIHAADQLLHLLGGNLVLADAGVHQPSNRTRHYRQATPSLRRLSYLVPGDAAPCFEQLRGLLRRRRRAG